MIKEKVLVLLVNYNTPELIPGVLDSVKEEKVDVTILVVDNGSSESSFKQLQKIKDARVTILRSEENLGYAGGNNFGLQWAAERFGDFKYVFLLNPDAICCPDLLFGLKHMLEANPDAASITPEILTKDGRPWYRGANFNFRKGKVSQSIAIIPDCKKTIYEVDVFNGCAVLFDLKKLRRAGLLSEKLFLYYEEAELSMRLHQLGYKNLYTPKYTVTHDVSYTTRKVSHVKSYYMTRNKFVVFNHKMDWSSKALFLTHELASHLKNKRFKNAVYVLKGYLHYKQGRSGKMQTATSMLFLYRALQEAANAIL